MNSLLLIGLVAAVLVTAAWRMVAQQPSPPQIIVVQAAPTAPEGGAGCMPLILLVGAIVLAVAIS